MRIFGKPVSEYFTFQKTILILIIVVGLGRLGLSLAGLPTSSVKWISLTAMAVVGIVYAAIQVPRRGFSWGRSPWAASPMNCWPESSAAWPSRMPARAPAVRAGLPRSSLPHRGRQGPD